MFCVIRVVKVVGSNDVKINGLWWPCVACAKYAEYDTPVLFGFTWIGYSTSLFMHESVDIFVSLHHLLRCMFVK